MSQYRNSTRIRMPRPSGFVVESSAQLVQWALYDIREAVSPYQVRVALGSLLSAGIDSPVAYEAAVLREEELGE